MKTLFIFSLAVRTVLSGTFCQVQTKGNFQGTPICRELICPFDGNNSTGFSPLFYGKPIANGDDFLQAVLGPHFNSTNNPDRLKILAKMLERAQLSISNHLDGVSYITKLLNPASLKTLCFIKTKLSEHSKNPPKNFIPQP